MNGVLESAHMFGNGGGEVDGRLQLGGGGPHFGRAVHLNPQLALIINRVLT